ncbi:UDP-glycosyltransferase 92A1-like [Triticum dicoccoides]|uniref:UDP-glycosyltransferase 92A1-like n=1 Tax=Triticum dicoccoides TaxID=85692 RepID=UPI001890D032|nr:UDP-glycosyltransferase 92A1-like [Triticum dicoccoides]
MATTSTKHVLLFPFPGQGHLAALLEVARLLRRALPADVKITIVSTPRNVAALRASSSASPSSSVISFHALPFVPADHGLPADCESTISLPLPAFLLLFEAFESLEPAFDAYVSGLVEDKDDCVVIADVFVAWTVRVARRRGCGHAILVSCGALGTAILHALWKNMPALPFHDDGQLLRLLEHPEVELHRSQLSQVFLSGPSPGMDRVTAYMHRQIRHGYLTDAVLVNTVEELEPTGLAMVHRTIGSKVPVWPIGALVRDGSGSDTAPSETDAAVMRWLDSQQRASVLYISFGPQNSMLPKQMMELATALESTGRPFVWAFRLPAALDVDGAEECLPEGFEARASAASRGLLLHGWAPQVRILAHVSTGAFLSHCGWNSVLESPTHGVPIVGWPLSAEQFYNVKMLAEDWGACVELARGNDPESPVAESREVAEVIETVMGDTAMRRRVVKVRELMKRAWAEDGRSSRTALGEFFTAMQLH